MDHGRRFGWILVPTLACALLWVNCGNGGHTQSQADAGPPIDVITDVPRSDAHGPGVSVLQLHLNPTRDGAYVDAVMRPGVAAGMHLSSGFPAPVTGLVRGDPLYVDQWKPGQDAIFVATDHNHVTAIDATTGAQLWDVIVGPMVVLTNLPCPMSFPFGIMTTPIIDLPSRTMYVDSFQTIGGTTQKHYVYALSIDDGKTMPGWPVDVAAKVPGFNATDQNNHGALTLMNGTLYLPYGPVNGDCGNYHGWVVGISTTDPTQVEAYSTTANRGGIWTAVSSDGTSVFASSANNARGTTTWGGGETFFRFTPELAGSRQRGLGPRELRPNPVRRTGSDAVETRRGHGEVRRGPPTRPIQSRRHWQWQWNHGRRALQHGRHSRPDLEHPGRDTRNGSFLHDGEGSLSPSAGSDDDLGLSGRNDWEPPRHDSLDHISPDARPRVVCVNRRYGFSHRHDDGRHVEPDRVGRGRPRDGPARRVRRRHRLARVHEWGG
jgi:hypothetical protein